MTNINPNLRKAAVFIRSLDADTAAKLLGQLSPEEANEIRSAIRALGTLDPDEQADVAAAFRRAAPVANRSASHGVELELSAAAAADAVAPLSGLLQSGKRFEFLEQAPVEALVKFLIRERVQTIAVVLSFLAPRRAANVLAALPATLQAETVERLSVLGETDPDSLTAVERELSDWLKHRSAGRHGSARRSDSVLSILAATDANTRDSIMANLTTQKSPLAKQLAPLLPSQSQPEASRAKPVSQWNTQAEGLGTGEWGRTKQSAGKSPPRISQPRVANPPPQSPQPSFDDLVLLSTAELAAVLRDVDANVLVLALAASNDELADRICDQMPRRVAKAFRRQLGRMGPTRLSDVEAAQRIVADAAARRLQDRPPRALSTTM